MVTEHKFPDEETTADEATRLEDEKQFLQLHHLLKTILHIVPMYALRSYNPSHSVSGIMFLLI